VGCHRALRLVIFGVYSGSRGCSVAGRNWPFLLTALLQEGWTKEGLAHVATVPVRNVDEYLKGRQPTAGVALELSKVVSAHSRKNPHRFDELRKRRPHFPRIVDDPFAFESGPEKPRRGVFLDPAPPPETTVITMIAADGTRLVRMEVHDRAAIRDFVPGFKAWLNEVDTILELVKPS
jgi:hypothetical protein